MSDIFDTVAPRKDIFDLNDFGGTPPGTISTAPAQWKQTASQFYTPLLEGGGAAGGGMVGIPGGPVSAALGGTLGYAAGRNIARNLDVALGLQKPLGAMDLATQTAEDLATGATYEMGGQALAPAFRALKEGGKWVFRKTPALAQSAATGFVFENPGEAFNAARKAFTKRGQEKAAGKVLMAHTTAGDIYAANADEAAELEAAIPGLRFTRGQRTYDPATIRLERAQISGQGDAAARNLELMQSNDDALRKHLAATMGEGGGVDDLTAELMRQQEALTTTADDAARASQANLSTYPNRTGQETGEAALGAVQRAQQPVKQTMGALEAEIPDYPMEFTSTMATLKGLQTGPQSAKLSLEGAEALAEAEKALGKVLDKGKTTYTAFGARRTINNRISKLLSKPETEEAAAQLIQVRDALEQDLARVSQRMQSGKAGVYRGQVVDVDRAARDLETTLETRARLAAEAKPDVRAMENELERRGVPFMKVLRESDEAHAQRIAKDYKRVTGQDAPTVSASPEQLAALDTRAKQLRTVLQEVEPGSDVAAAMSAYNRYAHTEYFGRFDKGAIARATARGSEASGTRSLIENVGKAFTTPSGADDLIRAVGPEEAKQVMLGHYAYDLHRNATDDTGAVAIPKLRRWYAQNQEALKKYGLDEQFGTTVKMQELADEARKAAAEFEKSVAGKLLATDTQKAVRSTLSGANAGAKAAQLMERVKGSKTALAGLQKAYADELMRASEVATETLAGGQVVSSAKLLQNMNQAEQVLRVIYRNEPEKLRALMQVRRAYQIAIRNTKNPTGMAGSDTQSLLLTELGKRVMTRGKIGTFVAPVLSLLTKHSDDAADAMLTRALFDGDYAQTLVNAARGKIPPNEIPVVLNRKIIDLETYRNQRRGQAAAGIAAGTGATFGNDDAD